MKKVLALLLAAALLVCAAGCKAAETVDNAQGATTPALTTPTTTPEPTTTSEPITTPAPTTTTQQTQPGLHDGHKAGDRFPMTIMLEGMEEQAMAEHFVNQNGAYCLDYFYEDFELLEDPSGESFLWRGIDGGDILGYMCLSATPGLKAADQAELIGLRMDAKAESTTFAGYDALVISGYLGDSYVTHYVFDTPRGCVEVEMACIIEGLEGIGARMNAMAATLQILP